MLVATCTGGERGRSSTRRWTVPTSSPTSPRSAAQEMERAREILGVAQDWLGFVDSGLPEGDPLPPLPEGCFALVPVEEAAEPLVKLIRGVQAARGDDVRRERRLPASRPHHVPQDHDARRSRRPATRTRYPDAGEPWQPLKLYYHHGFTPAADRRAARGDARARPRVAVRRAAGGVGGRPRARRRGSPRGCRAPTTSRSATRRCSRTRRRSIPKASWFVGPARGAARRRGRPRTSSSSESLVETSCPRTTCSRASASLADATLRRVDASRHQGTKGHDPARQLASYDPNDVKPGWIALVIVALLGVGDLPALAAA